MLRLYSHHSPPKRELCPNTDGVSHAFWEMFSESLLPSFLKKCREANYKAWRYQTSHTTSEATLQNRERLDAWSGVLTIVG
jgi:hypothetical protein